MYFRHNLAIIIPAYKKNFFDKALRSLAEQTNKNFTVYIGDDASADNLREIADHYSAQLNICYHRFPNNIGAKHLVNQWNRCVALAKNEKWLWLFSDDDIADSNCVEVFYNTIEKDKASFDVYRFNTRIINDYDEVTASTFESPFVDSSYNMAKEILYGNRGNAMPDHIFSRAVYEKYNGFVYTDYAQAADWATSILFSSEKGICTMPGAKVNWRLGSYNITGFTDQKKAGMIKGHLQFLNWALRHFNYLEKDERADELIEIKKALAFNMNHILFSHYKAVYYSNFTGTFRFLYKLHDSGAKALYSTLRLYYNLKFNFAFRMR
jgi:glycosyltransferase involved in cell wall biosynthesis